MSGGHAAMSGDHAAMSGDHAAMSGDHAAMSDDHAAMSGVNCSTTESTMAVGREGEGEGYMAISSHSYGAWGEGGWA